jgi:two-component system phosphate regulon sensor histidine kinase PhoR
MAEIDMMEAGVGAIGEGPLRDLIEALPEPALIVAAGLVRTSNAAARKLLGEGIEEQAIREAVRHPAAVERLLTANPQAAEEAELIGLGEAKRRWTMSVAPIEGGALFIRFADRSEAHAAERMRVDFVANASHELRTPLATLVGYSETLREAGDTLDEATRERFTIIVHDEARRMQRLVEDLISLSRIEAEKFSAPTDAVPLRPLVEEAIGNARYPKGAPTGTLKLDAEPDLPSVAGERNEIQQLLDNLISNALRYGRRGGPVTVRVARERDMVRVTVSDEGEGIPAKHIPRVTERFYRVDPSRSRSLGGTGLGLSIVKHIVERHRGRLKIESEVGRGTSVHVLLPVAL